MRRRAFSYVRFSDKGQGKGDSKRRQQEASVAYCLRRGWDLDSSLSLEDLGISAFKGRNASTGALAGFLAAIEEGRVKPGDTLIVESVDRLSRDHIMEADELFSRILRAGIIVVTLSPEREYSWAGINAQPFTKMELVLYMVRANEESATKSRRVTESWQGRRTKAQESKKPITGVCPQWLQAVSGRFQLVPERAEIVRRMFSMTLDGHAPWSIARALNREGIPTFSGASSWGHDYVWDTLRSRTTIGEFQAKRRGQGNARPDMGAPIVGYYPAVVDAETFHRAQGCLLARRKATPGGRSGKDVASLFTGLCFDARDHEPMQIHRNGALSYLVSGPTMRGCGEYVGLRYEAIEQAFLLTVAEVRLSEPVSPSVASLESARAELTAVVSRIEKVKTMMVEEELEGLLDVLRRLEGRRKVLVQTVERLEAEVMAKPADDLAALQSMLEKYETECVEGRREEVRGILKNKIRSVVEAIWVLPCNLSKFNKEALVQVFFKAGGRREFRLLTVPKKPVEVLFYADAFTEGERFPLVDLRLYKDA